MKRKTIFNILKIIIVVYCIIGIALYYLQEKFLFHPEKLEAGYAYHFDQPFQELSIPVNEADTISLVKFFPADSIRKGVVIYYHGNRTNINRYAKFTQAFTAQGYEVWMPDYPGFGKSRGERTEKKMLSQALQVERMAEARFGKDSIILYGKSLGTGVAAYVAAQTDCKKLILETPYSSIPGLFSYYAPIYPTTRMSNYKFPTYEYLQQVKYPVTIFHGTSDNVIPYKCAAKLKQVLKPGDAFISIEKGEHNNLADFPLYRQKLDSILR